MPICPQSRLFASYSPALGGTYYLMDGEAIVAEIDSGSSVMRRYVFRPPPTPRRRARQGPAGGSGLPLGAPATKSPSFGRRANTFWPQAPPM